MSVTPEVKRANIEWAKRLFRERVAADGRTVGKLVIVKPPGSIIWCIEEADNRTSDYPIAEEYSDL